MIAVQTLYCINTILYSSFLKLVDKFWWLLAKWLADTAKCIHDTTENRVQVKIPPNIK
jgi:hypothetical protein